MSYQTSCNLIRSEISQFEVDDCAIQSFYEQCEHNNRLFILAAGRSLLMMKAFAMRLMHLGYEVHILDEVTCPAITDRDMLIIASGSGTTAGILEKAKKAKAKGSTIAVWTQNNLSPLAALSDICLSITKQESKQPGASLFEQTLLLALDGFISMVMDEKQLPLEEVYQRHANLE